MNNPMLFRSFKPTLVLAVATSCLTACGQFLYVGTTAPAVEIFDIRDAGNVQQMLRKPSVSLPDSIGAPSAMTVVDKSLYLAGGSSVIAQYDIDSSTGALTLRGTVPTGSPPYSMARLGQSLYVGAFGSNDVRIYSIATNGALASQQTVPAAGINSLHTDSTAGKFLFTGHRSAGAGSPQLCSHTVLANGSLNMTPACVAVPGAPTSMQSASGVLFVLFNATVPPNPGNSNFVSAWSIDQATGVLSKRGNDLDIGAANVGQLAISTNGQTLFLPRQGNFTLVGTANPLTASAASFPNTMSQFCLVPPAAGYQVAVNPNGKAMYLTDTANVTLGTITGRRIAAIDLTGGSPLKPIICEATGAIPQSIAIFAQ